MNPPRNSTSTLLTIDDIVADLERRKDSKTLQELADDLGIDFREVSHILARKRMPSKKALEAMELERVVMYRRIR